MTEKVIKSIKAHPDCLHAAWSASIVHQSNSEAGNFLGNRLHCAFGYALFICCHPCTMWLMHSVLFRRVRETARSSPWMLHAPCTELLLSLQCEHEFADNKKMSTAVRCKYIPRVCLDSGFTVRKEQEARPLQTHC